MDSAVKVYTLKELGNKSWVILAPKGHALTKEMYFADKYEAEDFVRAYVSSFICSTYKIEFVI